MNERKLTVTELVLFAGTRVALGMGIGLLMSRGLNNDQRKAAGLALTIVGAISTVPVAVRLAQQAKSGDRTTMPTAA